MTDDVLAGMLLRDPLLSDFNVIMIDDCHERTVNTDLILSLVKKVLKKRPELKVVISSATLDVESYRHFFSDGDPEQPVELFSVQGRNYAVDIFYLEKATRDYVLQAVECSISIHRHQSEGDILIFLTGKSDIDSFVKSFTQTATAQILREAILVPCHAGLALNDQLKVFEPAPIGKRKLVLSTNIAETSVTIPDIAFVIDCCFTKVSHFDPASCCHVLSLVPAS